MKYVDEFRDPELGRVLAAEILAAVEPGRHYKFMEVCGGHTHSIYKYGVDDLLPANVELVHGPGCPVCVIPMGRVDDGIAIARRAASRPCGCRPPAPWPRAGSPPSRARASCRRST